MGEVRLALKRIPTVTVHAGALTTNLMAGKTAKEIGDLMLREGKRPVPVSSFFDIIGESGNKLEEVSLTIEGDLKKFKWVGHQMHGGKLTIRGPVGYYVGEEMTAGSILVEGDADSWVGLSMKGGSIEVKGNAGDFVGASYRGCASGMSGGTILVHGNAGESIGHWMSGGLLRIKGSVGQFAGIHMKGGMLVVEGNAGDRIGAEMTGGRMILLGRVETVLPGFIVDETRGSVRVGEERIQGPFYFFRGDIAENWNGSLMVSVNSNPHLKFYKALIA